MLCYTISAIIVFYLSAERFYCYRFVRFAFPHHRVRDSFLKPAAAEELL